MRAFSRLHGVSSWTWVHFGRAHGNCSLSLTSSAPAVGCSVALGFHLAGLSICPLFCRTPTFLPPCRMSLTTQLTHHSPLPSPLSASSLLSPNPMRVKKGPVWPPPNKLERSSLMKDHVGPLPSLTGAENNLLL